MTRPTVDRLEVVLCDGPFAPFAPHEHDEAAMRALDIDATGTVRERLSDGSVGRTWRVQAADHDLRDRRRRIGAAA